ncbi:MAG: 2-amino-4-hydroxy-6-hydroxymethyldihydropteridine diphosphokinase [Alphaproteobacteria bacterium]|nr:2-amino-4-hydroxy-6-hydroxymethyldihydropteridine diphosphokinase [Alphaproteobacteria bacterium]
MILLGLGANLTGKYGVPECALEAAKLHLESVGIRIRKASRIWLTAPVPASDQPWYRNAVLRVETDISPSDLLSDVCGIEHEFGRVRMAQNEPRVLDIDVLAYHDIVQDTPELILPHPRMHERAFVLMPMLEVAPDWVHPRLGKSVPDLIAALAPGQEAKPLVGESHVL